jgi:hypothetical protein
MTFKYSDWLLEVTAWADLTVLILQQRGRRVRDRIVVGFITTYLICAYHH